MSQPVEDLRVKRSQRFLREALIDLIEERGFDALSVGEITERAMVSRATFYRLYRDKFDLVEQIYAEAIQALPQRCRQVLTLRKIHGLSHREIATRLGISEHTVNAQVAIGVLRLRDHLRAHGIHDAGGVP